MSILLIDVETTTKGGPEGDSPEAHWPINELLMVGWSDLGGEICTGTPEEFRDWWGHYGSRYDTIVAHNAKFDIKWLMRTLYPLVDWEDYHVHCTMTYEYLNSGQASRFSSLEGLAKMYGFTANKTMDLGEYISAGGRMEDIPKDDLTEYLKKDIEILYKVFNEQDLEAWDMDYIHPLAEMELNGLPLDVEKTEEEAEVSAAMCDGFVTYMKEKIKINCQWIDGTDITDADFEKKIKPTANRTLSFLLTGMPEKVKTTSDKWTFERKPGGRVGLKPSTIAAVWSDPPNHLGYKMDEKHIAEVCKHVDKEHWINMVPKWRHHDKLLNTYYLPFLTKAQFTGCLHPKLNTTATATGRLSSSDPNGQNMPKEARELIRAPEGYDLWELDFSQLELIALAMLCGDKQMIKDIEDGEDIHFNSGMSVMGWEDPSDMDKESRKKVKNVNFGAVYGGKPPGLSKQTGISQKVVKELITSLYRRYPGIARWQRQFYEEVVENMEPNGHDDNGEQMYKSTVIQGGRTYTFFETPSPKWLRAKMGRSYSFNPNQVYNYPIQGYAGWQIVLQYLTRLWQVVREHGLDCNFIMTVHDSIVVLVSKEQGYLFKDACDRALQILVNDLTLSVPLSLDFEHGPTWS